jgi:hypothetical protein
MYGLSVCAVGRPVRACTDATFCRQSNSVAGLVNPKECLSRAHLEYISIGVPRADAKWLGQLLARLSPAQVHDAFRAAG